MIVFLKHLIDLTSTLKIQRKNYTAYRRLETPTCHILRFEILNHEYLQWIDETFEWTREKNFVYEPLTIIITYVCHIFQWIIRCNSNNIIIKYEAFKSSLHISKINTKPLHTKHFLNRRRHDRDNTYKCNKYH